MRTSRSSAGTRSATCASDNEAAVLLLDRVPRSSSIVYLVCRGIVKSRVGRALVAIRDNETAAAVMGVNLVATKAFVFGISAALCALPGSCHRHRTTGGVSPEGVQPHPARRASPS